MTNQTDDNDMSADYARQRSAVEVSLGRVFRNASLLAAYWDDRPLDALRRRAPSRWHRNHVEEPGPFGSVSSNASWPPKEAVLRSFLEFANRKPIVASVLALTAGAVALYAMKLASEQD